MKTTISCFVDGADDAFHAALPSSIERWAAKRSEYSSFSAFHIPLAKMREVEELHRIAEGRGLKVSGWTNTHFADEPLRDDGYYHLSCPVMVQPGGADEPILTNWNYGRGNTCDKCGTDTYAIDESQPLAVYLHGARPKGKLFSVGMGHVRLIAKKMADELVALKLLPKKALREATVNGKSGRFFAVVPDHDLGARVYRPSEPCAKCGRETNGGQVALFRYPKRRVHLMTDRGDGLNGIVVSGELARAMKARESRLRFDYIGKFPDDLERTLLIQLPWRNDES